MHQQSSPQPDNYAGPAYSIREGSMMTELQTVCGLPLVPAPQSAKGKKLKLLDWQRKLVPLVLEACSRGEDAPVKELSEKVGMGSANYAATALGNAKGGGLRMWKSGSAIKACQENVAIAIAFLHPDCDEDKQTELVADTLGVDEDEVREAFERLPKASEEAAA